MLDLLYRINYEIRRSRIKDECYNELIELITEISKYCPHNINDYIEKELLRITDKYCEENQYQIQ